MPSASVIIPTFNRCEMLLKALASVAAQTYKNFEIIVVDDGSTDGTEELFARGRFENVTYLRQNNLGPSAARNTAADVATGDYLAFLDDDDEFVPIKLEVQIRALEQHPEWGLVAGGWVYIDERGTRLDEERPWEVAPTLDLPTWLFTCPILPSSIVVRRAWMQRVGGWALLRSEDYDLGLRLALAGCAMGWTTESVFAYRIHRGNFVLDAAGLNRAMLAVLDSFFQRPDLPRDVAALYGRVRAYAVLRGAPREFAAGQVQQARDAIAQAVRLEPGLLGNKGQVIFDLLTAMACRPFAHDPLEYARTVFDALPDEAEVVRARKREAIATVAMARCFQAFARSDWRSARRMLTIGVVHDPRWLLNRGVLSILVRTTACER